MKCVTKTISKKSVVKCPQCGWTLLVGADPDLNISTTLETIPPKVGMKSLGCLKCPRCKNQIDLYYN